MQFDEDLVDREVWLALSKISSYLPIPARPETTHDYLKRVWGYAVRAMYHAVIRESLEKFDLPVELATRVANDTAPLGVSNTGPPWPHATWDVFERKIVDYFTNTSTDLL